MPSATARPVLTNDCLLSRPESFIRHLALFLPEIANLKTTRTLALDDDVAVAQAQFDLS
jgi:hypothetical protein